MRAKKGEMTTTSGELRIAIAQKAPVFLNRAATTELVLSTIADAAAEGARLLVFPETFLPGYPMWVCRTDGAVFDDADQKAAHAYYLEQAVEADGPELRSIAQCARDHGVLVYLGIAERGNAAARGTVYCSLAVIEPEHGQITIHRKLLATYDERLAWGHGDGYGLRCHNLDGMNLGGLICWENWMPQARHALYADGEDVHISVWPGNRSLTKDISRFIALEGRVWSVAAGAVMTSEHIPADFPLAGQLATRGPETYFDGGSAVVSPTGEFVIEPVAGEERLIIADLNSAAVREERLLFDATGHYARPDVFSCTVDRRRRDPVLFVDDQGVFR